MHIPCRLVHDSESGHSEVSLATVEVSLVMVEQPQEVQERFLANEREISMCLNLSELVPYLCEKSTLLTLEEGQMVLDSSLTKQHRVKLLFKIIKKKGSGFNAFLKSLQREQSHLGHAYITSLLEGQQYACESDIACSKEIKGAVIDNFTVFTKSINLTTLVPHLFQNKLLTEDERDYYISDIGHSTEKAISLFSKTLESKGPLAYNLFAKCLHDEHSHKTHNELFDLLSVLVDYLKTQNLCSSVHDSHDTAHVCEGKMTVCKRLPDRLRLCGPLRGKEYEKLMTTFQGYHHSGGNWRWRSADTPEMG